MVLSIPSASLFNSYCLFRKLLPQGAWLAVTASIVVGVYAERCFNEDDLAYIAWERREAEVTRGRATVRTIKFDIDHYKIKI